MSHAHEAAVAEARQAWRLEFWRRVADARMERQKRALHYVLCGSALKTGEYPFADADEACEHVTPLVEKMRDCGKDAAAWKAYANRITHACERIMYLPGHHALDELFASLQIGVDAPARPA